MGRGQPVRPHWGFLCPTVLGLSQPGGGAGSLWQAGRMRLGLHNWDSSLGLAYKCVTLASASLSGLQLSHLENGHIRSIGLRIIPNSK